METLFEKINYAHILYTFYLGLILFLISYKRKDFWSAITGGDGLDTEDLIKLVWFVLFVIIVLSDLFMDYKVDKACWASLDAIFFGFILKDLGKQYLENKKNKGDERKSD